MLKTVIIIIIIIIITTLKLRNIKSVNRYVSLNLHYSSKFRLL